MCTARNVGGTWNVAGPSASSDSLGIPCWSIQSLIALEDLVIRAVGLSRLYSLVGSILLSRTNLGVLRIFMEISGQKSILREAGRELRVVRLVSTSQVKSIFATYSTSEVNSISAKQSTTRIESRSHATIKLVLDGTNEDA